MNANNPTATVVQIQDAFAVMAACSTAPPQPYHPAQKQQSSGACCFWAGWYGCGGAVEQAAMTAKATWIWTTVAVGLFAFIYFFERRLQVAPTGPARVLPALRASAVSSVRVLSLI